MILQKNPFNSNAGIVNYQRIYFHIFVMHDWIRDLYSKSCSEPNAIDYIVTQRRMVTPKWIMWTGSPLVEVWTCHLFGAKPFPHQCFSLIGSWTTYSKIWIKYISRKYLLLRHRQFVDDCGPDLPASLHLYIHSYMAVWSSISNLHLRCHLHNPRSIRPASGGRFKKLCITTDASLDEEEWMHTTLRLGVPVPNLY